MKEAKLIYRVSELYYGRNKGLRREMSLLCDREIKKLVRSKRNKKQLYYIITETRWIKRVRNWKHRSKKKRQYMKHKLSFYERIHFLRFEEWLKIMREKLGL